MATIKTAQFGSTTCPQAQLDVTTGEDTGGYTVFNWALKWVTHGYTVSSSQSKAWVVKIDNNVVKEGTFAIGGKTNTTIASGTCKINKGTSSRSIPIYISFAMTFTWSGTSGGTKTASGTVNLGAKSSYTISYNANGGSGAPGNQTKWFDTNITLSTSIPSRTGHNFVRWNTNTSNTGTAYSPGATYSGNANLTLYAIWTPHTYTVHYNANGGSGAPGDQTKTYGTNLTLSSTKPTRTNYNFLGWSTSASGSVVYAAGATYSNNSAVTLYAVWGLAYQRPKITNFNAYRCTSNGTASETGTYIRFKFNWTSYFDVQAVVVDWTTDSNWGSHSNLYVSGSGKSGSVDQVVGNNEISIENTYFVRGFVRDGADSTYSSHSNVITIGTVKFPIDVKAGGKGVAIGKVAETENVFDVGFPTKLSGGVTGDIIMNTGHGAKVYWKEGGYGDQFAILPEFSGADDNNKLKVMAAVGEANTVPSLYDVATISGKNGNAWFKGNVTAPNFVGTASTANRSLKPHTYCSGSDNAGTTGWYLVASKNMNSNHEDVSITLLVTQTYASSNCGILRLKCRRDTGDAYVQSLTWVTRYGWSKTDACVSVSGTTVNLYLYNNVSQWARMGVVVLEDSNRGGDGAVTIHNTYSTSTGLPNVTYAADNMVFHPVGTVVCMSSNTSPGNYYGGSWELIDKEFASGDNIGGWSHNTTNVSSSDADFSRAGHSLFFSGGFTTKNQWEDSDMHLGTINFSSCGISRLGADIYFVAYTDDGNSGLMCEIEYDTGKLIVHDNFGDSYVAAGRNGKWSCSITVPMNYMLDAACNKFYWKRTG